jgi:hypothetical protein
LKFNGQFRYFPDIIALFQDCYRVCQSVTFTGAITDHNQIQSCDIIIGHVRILNARFQFENDTDTLFTNLVEVTDYILIFQASNIKTLEQLFPKLSVIRGDRLFKNYALTVFLCTSIVTINLKNLVSIQHGSVFLSRLYDACFVNTVDFDRILTDENAVKPLIYMTNSDCYLEKCPNKCLIDGSNKCWSQFDCQIRCPIECQFNCNINERDKCCTNPDCYFCTGHNDECISCLNFRDLTTGRCVQKCANDTLVYETHSCIPYEGCAYNTSSLVHKYHILENRACVRECPNGYTSVFKNQSAILYSVCQKCVDNVCRKICPFAYSLKTLSDLESIRNCMRVRQLFIELRTNITDDVLVDSLQYLEEITEFLVIIRNRHLKSLRFLKRLRLIGGEKLYENRFALFIHTNEQLRQLWDYEATNMTIANGTIKFFENPEFCFADITKFLDFVNKDLNDAEVSFHFNGYKRITCTKEKIDLNFNLHSNAIDVWWQIKFSDRRRLKGFILSYIQASANMTYDDNHIDIRQKQCFLGEIYNPGSEWTIVYIEYDERYDSYENDIISKTIEVVPYMRYAVYVYADVSFDSLWSNRAANFSFENDRIISFIHYVYSLPASKYL